MHGGGGEPVSWQGHRAAHPGHHQELCAEARGWRGAQRLVLSWSELVVSVEMSLIAQKSNVSPWTGQAAPVPRSLHHLQASPNTPPSSRPRHPPSRLASRHPSVSPAQVWPHCPCAGWAISYGISHGIGQARLAGSVGFLFLLLYWPCASSATGCWKGAETWGRASPWPSGEGPFGK